MLKLNILIFLKIKSLLNFISYKQLFLYFLILWLFINYVVVNFSTIDLNIKSFFNALSFKIFKKNYYFISVLKSPMAHRQWSQEQYSISVKTITITVDYRNLVNNFNLFLLNKSNLMLINYNILTLYYLKNLLNSPFFSLKNLKFFHKFNYLLVV